MVGGRHNLGKYISPIITSILIGSVLWVIDSIIFALGMTSVSISGALFTEVSILRLSLRVLVFLVCLLFGVYTGYKASSKVWTLQRIKTLAVMIRCAA